MFWDCSFHLLFSLSMIARSPVLEGNPSEGFQMVFNRGLCVAIVTCALALALPAGSAAAQENQPNAQEELIGALRGLQTVDLGDPAADAVLAEVGRLGVELAAQLQRDSAAYERELNEAGLETLLEPSVLRADPTLALSQAKVRRMK